LTGDDQGFLYSADRGGTLGCTIKRVPASGGPSVDVGHVPAPCAPNGVAFDAGGNLYITGVGTALDEIWVVKPAATTPVPEAVKFAGGVPGANGIAFDKAGNLWATDGTTGQGRVWRVSSDGAQTTEMFRIQPLVNSKGVGRQFAIVQPGSPAAAQITVANGIAFTRDGSLLVADTARGALWQVDFDDAGNIVSPTGCDVTYASDTLCLEDVFVESPALFGVDGIALDRAGNIWAAENERNAIVVVSSKGSVSELFRNPPDAATMLRNGGPLERPTSPFLLGRRLCVTSMDTDRGDNSPNTAGEAAPATAVAAKISCLDQSLQVPGLALPVHGDVAAVATGGVELGMPRTHPTLKAAFNKMLKRAIVVDGTGRTLYMFAVDTGGTSSCAAYSPDCPKIWPALTSTGKPLAGAGLKAALIGTTPGAGGKTQVTYNHHPLYYYHGGSGFGAGDKKPGDLNGEGLGSEWYVLSPSGKPIRKGNGFL
jgi:sugar lactone lactonase YvrE/predicted lipoprotein with Yx(FWY)xxD motif